MVVHLLEHDSMWMRAHGAWVEQTPTNMCHSINRMAHRAPFIADRAYSDILSFHFYRDRRSAVPELDGKISLPATIARAEKFSSKGGGQIVADNLEDRYNRWSK